MGMVSEQVKELRELTRNLRTIAEDREDCKISVFAGIILQAANTIESLSAKLSVANMEKQNNSNEQSDGLLIKGIIIPQKVIEKIEKKAGFYVTSEVHFLNAVSKILGVNTIPSPEKLWKDAKSLKIHDMEQAAGDGWIPASERLPEEKKEVLVWYEYFIHGSCNKMFQAYGIGHLEDGRWYGGICGCKTRVIAWQPLPEPYHEP